MSLTASCLVVSFLGCESLPEIEPCGPCKNECPNGMVCQRDICVRPGEEDRCQEDTAVVTATGEAGGTTQTASSDGGPSGAHATGGAGGSSAGAGAGNGGSGGTPTAGTTLGAAGNGEAGDGGTTGSCDPPRTQCVPNNTNLAHEHEVCGNREFSIQLKAQCECDEPTQAREMTWLDTELPESLALTKSGKLSGALPPGTYTVVTPAQLTGDPDVIGHLEQTIHVLDRCLVTFLSEAESPGVPRIQAVRLDTLAVDGWMPEDAGVAVERYDISSDGRYLAAVVDGGDTLELFSLTDAGVPNLEFEHEGVLSAHAFSLDARWLAVVTTDPAIVDGELVHLVKLEGATWQLVEVAPLNSFVTGLAWYGDASIAYLGTSAAAPPSLAPLVRHVTDAGLSSVSEIFDALIDPADPFYGFLTNDTGFVSSSLFISGYVDLGGDFHNFAEPIQAVSPGLQYRALIESDVLTVNPVVRSDAELPYATAEGCTELRAWSADDGTLLCSTAHAYTVFEVEGNGDLRETQLDVAAAASASWRATLSASGRWLAFLPTAAGLHVVPKSSYAEPLGGPLLETLIGGWDFFFTPSEQRIIIQQADHLWVAELNEQESVEPLEIDLSMGAVAPCGEVWSASNPALWCGAPAVKGNMVLSSNERYLAVRDFERSVFVIPLDTRKPEPIGALSESCSEGCIQFQ